jgi:hypothetical protein
VWGALKRIILPDPALALFALGALLATVGPGCARDRDADARHPGTTLAEALRPAFFAEALRRAGGGHYHGTARFSAAGGSTDDGVTTTTDVWVDGARNYRVVETNDRDGGREVVLVGRELFVALRYGKMIRRVAEEPEPTRVLEDALGAPWAAWELAAPWASLTATPGGAKTIQSRVSRATARTEEPATAATATGLRAWRAAAVVTALDGRGIVDETKGTLNQIELKLKFTTKRDGLDLTGQIEVRGALTDVEKVPAIARPPSEELALRQRTVPEQHELLAGLPVTHPPPAQPQKPGAAPAHPVPAETTTTTKPTRPRP